VIQIFANATHAHAPASFLVLGDSYSIGEGVAEGERWPAQLATMLRSRGVPLPAPQYIARTGWTTDELDAAIDEQERKHALHPPYGLVSLQIGVNDQYRGRPLAQFRAGFVKLLERAVKFAGGNAGNVIVLSIPDWGQTEIYVGEHDARIAREIESGWTDRLRSALEQQRFIFLVQPIVPLAALPETE